MDVTWRALDPVRDLAGLVSLARRCLDADGGLPIAADEEYVQRRYAVTGSIGLVAVDADGVLVAAGRTQAKELDGSTSSVIAGMVDPKHRGLGLGTRLLDQALDDADYPPVVEVDSLTETARALIESRGFRIVWAEDVMRFALNRTAIPDAPLPAGVSLRTWGDETVASFHRAYEESFRTRPGFPGWSVDEWVRWTTDEDFLPECSLLAVDGANATGFITCAEGWIVQVGVRPDARGRGVGAALVCEAMRRMRTGGTTEVLLDVNVDNPARGLYERLGFVTVGRRARFARAAS